MVKKCVNHFKHIIIHFISFIINYIVFSVLVFLFGKGLYTLQIINLISWLISILFIYYVDRYFFPDLINENNSKELYQFILIRILGLILESIILFLFVSVLNNNYFFIKLIGLTIMFLLNNFYVNRVKFK